MVITLPVNSTVFAFLGLGEDGCFHSLLCCFMVSDAYFCFHFDNWPRLVGARKHASVRARAKAEPHLSLFTSLALHLSYCGKPHLIKFNKHPVSGLSHTVEEHVSIPMIVENPNASPVKWASAGD
ncbi:hypothetical protein TNCV_2856731 [Trichonephila clavipes]|nr:hypothetical protein TNCV_2856731 [Trichonephila clavipes]